MLRYTRPPTVPLLSTDPPSPSLDLSIVLRKGKFFVPTYPIAEYVSCTKVSPHLTFVFGISSIFIPESYVEAIEAIDQYKACLVTKRIMQLCC